MNQGHNRRPHDLESRLSCDAGYTLLELIVVLAIISFAAAVMLPRVGAGGDRVALRAATIQLAAGLQATRNEAMSASKETAFVIDIAHRRYWADGAVKARSLASGIGIVTGNRPGEAVSLGRATVRFQPDGSASGGWIGLRAKNHSASITVDWLTGASRIEWGK